MKSFDQNIFKQLYTPPPDSHKGENGKLLLIGGSHLFHASALWALEVASKIVDMVFFASVQENNEIVQQAKEQFRNGIVVPRKDVERYVQEADSILIGPGMVREEYAVIGGLDKVQSIDDIAQFVDSEGAETHFLTGFLLRKYKEKKWIIDAGALQMLNIEWLKEFPGNYILTPHHQEFELVFHMPAAPENVEKMAKEYNCIIVLKGEKDIVCSANQCVEIPGGNAGMTKGGTGDVLAGLIAALACKNDTFLAATAGSYINKRAGERLFDKVGYYFNSTDLVNEIPMILKDLILGH